VKYRPSGFAIGRNEAMKLILAEKRLPLWRRALQWRESGGFGYLLRGIWFRFLDGRLLD
jgi:hypothetical protein